LNRFHFVSNAWNAHKFLLSIFQNRRQNPIIRIAKNSLTATLWFSVGTTLCRRAINVFSRRGSRLKAEPDSRNHIDAIAKAKSLYLSLSQRVKEGDSLENRTFERAWREWYSSKLASNVWSESRKKWFLNYFLRYFQAYFGEEKLDQITNEFANAYFDWRKRYWDGPGANQVSYNRRRKGLKTHSSYNAKKNVSFTTLRMEQSALNQFFNWCYSSKRYIRYPIKLKVDASQRQKQEGRRATFNNAEWNVLTRNLLSWAEGKGKYADDRLNEYHRHQRQQLRS
jgi:hypothetical protein